MHKHIHLFGKLKDRAREGNEENRTGEQYGYCVFVGISLQTTFYTIQIKSIHYIILHWHCQYYNIGYCQ